MPRWDVSIKKMQISTGQSVQSKKSLQDIKQIKPADGHSHEEHEKPAEEQGHEDKEQGWFDALFTGAINTAHEIFCKGISGYIKEIILAFNPFMDLVNKIDSVEQGVTTNKITVKEFDDLLSNTISKIGKNEEINKHLTEASRSKLMALSSTLERLSQRKDLQDTDLTELIKQWKQDKNTQALFGMVEALRNHDGKCISFSDRELREKFASTIETLAHSLDEIMSHPPSDGRKQAHKKVVEIIDPLVDDVETYNAAGSVENLTTDEKKHIAGTFQKTADGIKELTKDPALSKFVSNNLNELMELYESINSFLDEWLEEIEEKIIEEREKQKLCDERCEQEEEIQKLCLKHKIKKQEAEKIYAIMMRAKKKMLELIGQKQKSEISKYSDIYDFYSNKYNSEKNAEQYFKSEEGIIEDSLLPGSVCEHDGMGLSLNLDITC